MPLPSFTVFPVSSPNTRYGNGRPQMVAPQLFFVGTDIYDVTSADVGSSPSLNLFIKKSSDGGNTWTTVIDDSTRQASWANAVLVGTIIYISFFALIGPVFDGKFHFYRFDTTTDSMLSDSADIIVGDGCAAAHTLCACPDGRISVAYTNTASIAGVGFIGLDQVFYDPASDTWGTPQELLADSPTINDAVFVAWTSCCDADRVYIFYGAYFHPATPTGTLDYECITVDLATGSPGTPAAISSISAASAGQQALRWLGMACVGNGEVHFPYIDPAGWDLAYPNNGTLYIARATLATNPSFSIDTIETVPEYPALSIQTNPFLHTPQPVYCFANGGTVYVVYILDNGGVMDSTSEAWIYYQESTSSGVWSGRLLAWKEVPTPCESLTPFPAVDGSGNVGILVSFTDPTLEPDISCLTTVLLYISGTSVFGNVFGPTTGKDTANRFL